MNEHAQSVMTPAEKFIFDTGNMYKERAMTCTLALWSTLAGINGVFVSAASIIAAVDGKTTFWVLVGILVCCSISLICLLLNFCSLRAMYRVLCTNPPTNDSDAWDAYNISLKDARDKTSRQRQYCDWRENICFFLLAASILIIMAWIFTTHC